MENKNINEMIWLAAFNQAQAEALEKISKDLQEAEDELQREFEKIFNKSLLQMLLEDMLSWLSGGYRKIRNGIVKGAHRATADREQIKKHPEQNKNIKKRSLCK